MTLFIRLTFGPPLPLTDVVHVCHSRWVHLLCAVHELSPEIVTVALAAAFSNQHRGIGFVLICPFRAKYAAHIACRQTSNWFSSLAAISLRASVNTTTSQNESTTKRRRNERKHGQRCSAHTKTDNADILHRLLLKWTMFIIVLMDVVLCLTPHTERKQHWHPEYMRTVKKKRNNERIVTRTFSDGLLLILKWASSLLRQLRYFSSLSIFIQKPRVVPYFIHTCINMKSMSILKFPQVEIISGLMIRNAIGCSLWTCFPFKLFLVSKWEIYMQYSNDVIGVMMKPRLNEFPTYLWIMLE